MNAQVNEWVKYLNAEEANLMGGSEFLYSEVGTLSKAPPGYQ